MRRLAWIAFLVDAIALAAPPRVGTSLAASPSLGLAAVPRESRLADGRVAVSVWLPGGAERLRALGFDARPGAPGVHDLAFAQLSMSDLARLIALPEVVTVEPERRLRICLDQSVPMTGAPVARAALASDGRGALVGVVDTGVDFRHADLRNADGTTRIAALLDVGTPRTMAHPELPDYNGGAVWLATDIDAQLAADASGAKPDLPVTERDTNGHGTHVAGIAAGNGLATGHGLPSGRYVGMAPGASLVIAKATRDGGSFSESDILASVQFLLDRAAALGRPIAVNLSLGASSGPHDGSTSLERGLDALFPLDAPGRALVVAAGNGGSVDAHARGWWLNGKEVVKLFVPTDVDATSDLSIDLWTDPGPAPPAISVISPSGKVSGPIAINRSDGGDAMDGEGKIVIANALGGDPDNARHEVVVTVSGNGGSAIASGAWSLVLDGSVGRWDAWIEPVRSGSQPRFSDHLDPDSTAGLPGLATSAISVASFVSRVEWVTSLGHTITRASVVGRPSNFSATGPTLDGRFAPDVIAPGSFITSSLSADALPSSGDSVFHVGSPPDYLWADDGVHGLLQGTSQATPHVTGAAALLFSFDATLTPQRMRELLRASARVEPGWRGWSPKTAFGRLDVAAAARLVQPSVFAAVGPVDARSSTVGVSRDLLPPSAGQVFVSVVPRDANGAPLGAAHAVTITSDLDGGGVWAGPVDDRGGGRYERALEALAPLGSTATITATVDGVTLAARPTIYFGPERADDGVRVTRGGGCALAFGGTGGASVLLLCSMAALALALRRRSRR